MSDSSFVRAPHTPRGARRDHFVNRKLIFDNFSVKVSRARVGYRVRIVPIARIISCRPEAAFIFWPGVSY